MGLDLINVDGGNLARYEGIVVLAYVSDFLFDFSLVGFPPLIYLLFVKDLDVVRLSFKAATLVIEEEEAAVVMVKDKKDKAVESNSPSNEDERRMNEDERRMIEEIELNEKEL